MTFLTGMETCIAEWISNDPAWFMTFLTGMETQVDVSLELEAVIVYDLPNRDGNLPAPLGFFFFRSVYDLPNRDGNFSFG